MHLIVFMFMYIITALVQQRRVREMIDRDRRLRQYLRRRKAFLMSSVTAVLSIFTTTRNRHVWVRNRSSEDNFWSSVELFDDDEWKAQFRVSRATFDYLLEQVGPAIKRRRTNFRVPIEPKRRLAIALWWFARAGEYRTVSIMFGVGIATVCNIVRQVTSAILERLHQRFLSLPSDQRLDDVMAAFKERCYPQCAGAIGTTHIPVSPVALSRDRPDDYLNERAWVVLDVYAGWPGSTSSASVLSCSDLHTKAEDQADGYLFPKEVSLMIPVHLIGDTSFPLKPWLMKSYSLKDQLSPEQHRFTHTLSSACSVVDTAFTRLKGRWRCLLKKNDIDASNMSKVVVACCVLHNICEIRGDSFLPEWNTGTVNCSSYLRQPDMQPYDGDTFCPAEVHILYSYLLSIVHMQQQTTER
uniref:DDE Tnp4 domain-containing protein n=1 Tax=Takifugu rubripes TaxID=31033 RepID=A0A3B5KIL0_TAKRU